MEKIPTCELEEKLFKSVYSKTPDYIKNMDLINLSNDGEFTFTLKKENLYPYDENTNPNGLNLLEWFKGYSAEARVSTAGIRGPQNILYPQDTRFPINIVGIVLATLAKALVAKEKYPNKRLVKMLGSEVRYNSDLYMKAISRIQAAQGIETLIPENKQTIPIWLASFLVFKLDLLGGEYITSSHGISVKTATKDLNSQGSQYLPEESIEFVNKIQMIFDETEKNGEYVIKFSSDNNPLINDNTMKHLNDGVDLYVEYLKSGVAQNIKPIQKIKNKIVIENVGGSAYRTLSRVLEKLGISKNYAWCNIKEDPFFHGIGKYDTDPKGNNVFYDYSVDATVVAKNQNGEKFFPVIETLHYERILEKYPMGTIVLITDPDHDRLTVCQIENVGNKLFLDEYGISYVELDESRLLTVYTANQAFLMLMDYRAKQLKHEHKWDKHPRFIIKTTASALSWDEWAKHNGVKVVNVPVGFKEIANIMKKVEYQLAKNPNSDVIIEDVFGETINLGKQPRLLFAGEESGGMIMGPEDLIKSQHGRMAIAMREKSATEAIIVASSLASQTEENNQTLSRYLVNLYEHNNVKSMFDIRTDISYYNESEPDIAELKKAKTLGEQLRTKNDLFYLSLALKKASDKSLDINDFRKVLNHAFAELNFDNLIDIKFAGDGTYLKFSDKFVEIRPSGTDAKTKAYASGAVTVENLEKFSSVLGHYSGDRTELHREFITDEFYEKSKQKSMELYMNFTEKDSNKEEFIIPEYDF